MEEPLIRPRGTEFVDAAGRTVLLRGMNLGAGSKVPSHPDGATHLRDGFYDHRSVSFVGRPLRSEEADEHLERLCLWGFTHLRLAFTWEAVEHAGPGVYDTAFLDWFTGLVEQVGRHGMTVQVDPHQDVWSRFTGGDGAPGWTLEALGMDIRQVHATGSAILHQEHGDPFPRMVWPTNSTKIAAATMFTVFFAGNAFAPRLRVQGEPAQDFLQRRYCTAMAKVADRLKAFSHVMGMETMNEPHHGYIGHQDLRTQEVWSGDAPTPFQSMLLASGIPQEVEVHTVGVRGIRVTGRRVLNQDRARLWQDDAVCPWRQHGVWDVGPDGAPRLLRPDYFVACNGKRVDFGRDFLRPFTNRFTAAVRAAAPRTLVIVQTEINLRIPRWEKGDAGTIAFSPHWYDPLPLVLKKLQRFIAYDALHGKVLLGARAIRRGVAAQIGMLRAQAREELGGVPFILGETGVPMDLRNRSSLRGSPGPRLRAADRIMRGLEDALASSCWWNYAADNDSVHGDQWNGEDFSLFTADPRGLARGDVEHGRALQALVRPYPRTVAGQLLSLRFSRRTGSFRFSFRHDPAVSEPTEVFLPRLQYPAGYAVRVSDGTFRSDPGRQLLFYVHGLEQDVHVVSIRRKPG